ncbi:hypothetical protein QMK17_12625 [Rhodococcus sp. G-MC3]|uniref:hypothetical protein n=1 Tax=Rhodococcus sp. G-MC3 TaxID=3046209 RepID=UPI0024BBD75D|nr:hypothetical protein [Rhodococcus sp. G-MC3]MDJ0394174.1 hypothetical protein [Rhodococcus sp. G-MC3]
MQRAVAFRSPASTGLRPGGPAFGLGGRVCHQPASQPPGEQPGTRGKSQECAWSASCEAGDFIENMARFAVVEPGRDRSGPFSGLTDEIGCHAPTFGGLGHRTEFLAECSQTGRDTFLLS